MLLNNEHLRRFDTLINDTISHLKQLLITLEDEQLALCGINPENLEAAVVHKLELLKAIEASLLARERFQKQLNLPAGLQGGRQLVETAKHPTLKEHWQLLLSLVGKVEELNQINGQMISQGQRATKEALTILTGRNSTAPVYGKKPSGYAGSGFSSTQSLGMA